MAIIPIPVSNRNEDKYKDKLIKFIDKGNRYELIFSDYFQHTSNGLGESQTNTVLTDLIVDLKEADKNKEIHIFVGSYGGYVTTLNMLLQQISQFNHKVGINLGYACSCGFMLLAYCDEIYASPYSMFMYHSMSSIAIGKISELKNTVDFDQKWQKLLIEKSRIHQLLTEDELKLGETTEVWLTGQDLIDRNVVLPYEQYLTRVPIVPDDHSFYVIKDQVYRKEKDKFILYKASGKKELSYQDMIQLNSKEKHEE